MDHDDLFTLEPPPVTRSARHAARLRADREQCECVARRLPDYQAWRERAYMVCHGPDLAWVFDPAEDRSTLATVLENLTARVKDARNGKNPVARWWDRDLTVWRAGRLLATIRPAEGGIPVVTRIS